MYRFALRPRWLVSHVLVVALAIVLLNLGFWQLRRHDERADTNREVSARQLETPLTVDEVLDELDAGAEVGDLRYRRVEQVGRFLPGELLVDNRSLDGLPGAWVVAPFELDDGTIVAVNRGFIGSIVAKAVAPGSPEGEVTVAGSFVGWVTRSCGQRDNGAGAVVGSACLSKAAFEAATGHRAASFVIQATASFASDGTAIGDETRPVPLPELGAGPHVGYAGQWFVFAAIAIVGYPLVLRSVGRKPTDEVGDIGDEVGSTLER